MGEFGREPAKVDIDVERLLDNMDATTDWSVLGNDTTGLATTTNHVVGTAALTFNKVDGAANTTRAGIQKTITARNCSLYSSEDVISVGCLIPDLTDVASIFIRLGTSSSHYNEWVIDDSVLTTNAWMTAGVQLGQVSSVTGNGWNPASVTYVVVGVNFDAEANTLAGIIFDNIGVHTAASVTAIAGTFVGGGIFAVNLSQIAGVATTTGGGVEASSLRVTLASDSTGLVSVDDNGAALTVDWAGTAPPIGAGLEVTALRCTIATDSTGLLSVDDNAASLTIDNAVLDLSGGGTEAGAQRVTIASDSTGLISVDDNGAALTVDWAGTAPPIGAGLEATALRVTVATDSTGLLSVDDNASSLTIDNAVLDLSGGGTEAGAQRVTIANDSTGLISVDDNLSSLTIDNATLAVVGGGAEATAMRVTLASDSTGLLSVDDNGAALTVDWAGTAPPIGTGLEATALRVTLATDSTGLISVDDNGAALTVDWAGTAPPIGAGLEATALRVTVATDSTGILSIDDNAASLTVDNSDITAAATSLAVMDDWDNTASDGASVSGDVAHDGADAGEPVKVGYKAYTLDGTVPQTAVAEADRVNAISDLQGIQFVHTAHPMFTSASVDYAIAQTNATVIAAPGAGSLYITDIFLSNGATAGNVTLLNGSGGAVVWECYPAINGGASFCPRNPIKLSATTLLAITSTTVTTHSLTVCGFTA